MSLPCCGLQERLNRSEWGAVVLAAVGTIGIGATVEAAPPVSPSRYFKVGARDAISLIGYYFANNVLLALLYALRLSLASKVGSCAAGDAVVLCYARPRPSRPCALVWVCVAFVMRSQVCCGRTCLAVPPILSPGMSRRNVSHGSFFPIPFKNRV